MSNSYIQANITRGSPNVAAASVSNVVVTSADVSSPINYYNCHKLSYYCH